MPRIEAINQALSVTASSIQRLTVVEDQAGTLRTTIEIGQERLTLQMRKHSMRSDRFQVLVQYEPFGPLVPEAAPPIRTYRGSIVGQPGSRVGGSFHNGKLTALVRTSDGLYAVQPVESLGVAAAPDEYVIYDASDSVNREGYTCGNTAAHDLGGPFEPIGAGAAVLGTGFQVADLAIDADVEFFVANGSDVADTVLDIETILDTVEFIYERDVDISYEVTTIVVRTAEPDPYDSTNNEDLLNAFRATWLSTPEVNIQRDVAHLMTGKNVDGTVIGTAFLRGICNSLGFGFSQSTFSANFDLRVALTAHEIGHNWGANHCNDTDGSECHIMCSGINGCGGTTGANLKFGPTATSEIIAFRDSRTCLNPLADPIFPPFSDDFPSSTLDTTKWSYNNTAEVNFAAFSEPSQPFSLNLDGDASGFTDNEVRSNFIELGGMPPSRLSYFTEHRGVDAGEALVVEYWNNNLTWVEINRIVSDGVDQSTFDFHEHMLPSDANHDEFRIRFRTEVTSPGDDWYVDNVSVVAPCQSDAECDDGDFCNGVETCGDPDCLPGVNPCGGGETCNEDADICVDPTCSLPTITSGGSRYLEIVAGAGTDPVAFAVAPACDPSAIRFLGPPSGAENIALLVNSANDAARLTPAAWGGTVAVTDALITPDTDYFAWADCGTAAAPAYSEPTLVRTALWGDVIALIGGGFDGSVDINPDVIAIIDKFGSLPGAPSLARTDLIGESDVGSDCLPDQGITILDILMDLLAFSARTFLSSTGCPGPCP